MSWASLFLRIFCRLSGLMRQSSLDMQFGTPSPESPRITCSSKKRDGFRQTMNCFVIGLNWDTLSYFCSCWKSLSDEMITMFSHPESDAMKSSDHIIRLDTSNADMLVTGTGWSRHGSYPWPERPHPNRSRTCQYAHATAVHLVVFEHILANNHFVIAQADFTILGLELIAIVPNGI